MTAKLATSFLFGLLSWNLPAAPAFPSRVLPEGVGVNIHFTRGHERDLDLIAAAGFKFIRMDFGWGGIERKPGDYDWSAYDELTASLERRGLRAIYILDYSNGLYEETIVAKDPTNGQERRDIAAPHSPAGVAAFARWAAAAAKHYQGRGVIWEIWNEPNIGFWKPKPDVQQYTALALATCRAVRAADPQAAIIGPASSEFPWPFLEHLFASGALEWLDAVSVHPYRSYSQGPETVAADYLKLRGLIERYAPAGRKGMPIISGEWGYATQTRGVSLETQAAFIARQQLANLLHGVPISIWYDWKNDGLDPADAEHNFGTVSNTLALKPSYRAVQTLTRQLSGYHIARQLDTARAEDVILLLVNAAGDQKLAAWTTGQAHALELALDAGSPGQVTVVNGQSQALETEVTPGKVLLEMQAAPQYVTFQPRSRALSAAAAWGVTGFVPTLVEAGGATAIQIPLQVTNPFAQTVTVRLGMESPSGSEAKTLRLKPGQSASHTFGFAPRRRSAGRIEVRLSAEFRELTPDLVLGQSSDRRSFVISNPLALALAPVESGLRLTIQNPSGSRFEGTALIGGTKFPVRLDREVKEVTLAAPASAIRNSGTQEPRLPNPPAQAATAQLLAADGALATDPVTRQFRQMPLTVLKTHLDGDAKVPATATLVETNSPGGQDRPFTQAHRLDYRFGAGWRFVRCAPAGTGPVTLDGPVQALGLWVFGDNSGNSLRLRVTDSGGQTFQPSGPRLDWTGWRWVEFDLADLTKAGHWGGANDGVVHGALRLDTLLLVDGTREPTEGTLYFAGPTLISSAATR